MEKKVHQNDHSLAILLAERGCQEAESVYLPPAFLFAKNDICATIIIMKKKDIFITKSANQTRKLGEMLAKKLRGGKIICLVGELGSGKTTFAQGVLKGLGAKGPYTSPTFVILKRYKIKNQKSKVKNSSKNSKVKNIYHVDTYRIGPKDILDLGWREIISDKHNIIIVEWAEKIRRIIPKSAVWLKLEHKGKDEREITIK